MELPSAATGIVPFEMAQIIPSVLFFTGWSTHLEPLDQEERRSNENPTIGIILCKESDMETVRFALNCSMSSMMIMQYKEQLKAGGVIQRSIEEYCKYITSI